METLKNASRFPNPYHRVSIFSKLFFWYVNRIFQIGNKRQIKPNDIYKNRGVDNSKPLTAKLERLWNEEMGKCGTRKNPKFMKCLIKLRLKKLLLGSFFSFMVECTKLTQPIFLKLLLDELTDRTFEQNNDMFIWAGCLVITLIMRWFVLHPTLFYIEKIGCNLKSAALGMVYKKAIKMRSYQLGAVSTGHVITLASSDAHKIQEGFKMSCFIIIAPLEVIIATIILWTQLGPSCLAGIGILIIYVPLQTLMGKFFAHVRAQVAETTDERIQKVNELLSNMQVIKMSSWEELFQYDIDTIRKSENKKIFKTAIAKAVNVSMYGASPYIIMLCTVLAYYYGGNDVSISLIFLVMSMFYSIRLSVVLFFPLAVQSFMECYVSCTRIQQFLLQEELEKQDAVDMNGAKINAAVDMNGTKINEINGNVSMNKQTEDNNGKHYVKFNDVTATWSGETLRPIIQDMSFSANQINNLLFISGPVGSGKTSLLMTILKEIKITQGFVETNGKIAYVSQQPWIFAGTVRQNILFGMNYDKQYFQKVVEACALETDLKILEKGDKTVVGEKGDTLSGGQKARISLARAVYRNADIYLLDDPLSAVDATVGKQIFRKCIKGLLQNKIVILASHQTQYSKYATQVLHLEEDEAVFGDLEFTDDSSSQISSIELDHEVEERVRKKSRSLTFFFHHGIHRSTPDTPKPIRKNNRKLTITELANSKSISSIYDKNKRRKTLLNVFEQFEKADESAKAVKKTNDLVKRKQSEFKSKAMRKMSAVFADHITEFDMDELELEAKEAEPSKQGAVPYSLYGKYFIGGVGYVQTIFAFTLIVFTQALLLFTDYWTGDWSNGENQRVDNETITATFYIEDDPDKNIYVFIALVLTGSVLNLLRAILFYATLLKCSRKFHNKMLVSITKAPMYFFTSNPVGQILNRFSRDILMLDEELPWMFYNFLQFGLMNIAIIVINCVTVPYLIIVVVPLLIAAFYGRRYFIKTAAEVKKLESSSQSPLFTHFASTLSGITTIRTYEKCPFVLKEFYECMDYATEARITFLLCSRWFSQRIDFLALIFSVCAIFAPMIAIKVTDELDEGLIGVSLTYVLSLGAIFQWFIRQSAEVENLMTSVDRVYEYTQIESEKDCKEEINIKAVWPKSGNIHADHVTYAYHKSLPPVVKDMEFVINPKEKIGIVGRTGAGKSTLISMLLRLGHMEGVVNVDDYNIETLPLKFLRRNISVIPQNPVLFNGSLRDNLDPFHVFSDEEIWSCLEKVNMKESITELAAGLQLEISDSGSNMSVGERQLLCLARAVLKNNRILLIDEATSNVDNDTDILIQDTIRTVFVNSTVLTVAHRLNTIIDYDKIMVMDKGDLVEFDSPNNLLQNKHGFFRKLVDEVDERESNRLKQIALNRHIFSIGDDESEDGDYNVDEIDVDED